MAARAPGKSVSVIIPAYNEAKNLPILVGEIETAMASTALPYEIIIVDDGSTDGTRDVVRALAAEKPHVHPIYFVSNCGQSAGLQAGFRAATGDYLVTLDADLQNDPADIPRLLAELERFDAAFGWRTTRKDTWTKRLTSKFANRVRRWATGDNIKDTGCSLKAFRREAVQYVKLFTGMHRFLGSLLMYEERTITEVAVNHRARKFGKSKYNIFNRGLRPTIDLLAVMWMRRRYLHYRVRNGEG
jgi:glycosyltransferase involved in cell wall biosynthesis